ncbi:TlpA family protein disulfide reductase, partial [Singulisphaera rosea]
GTTGHLRDPGEVFNGPGRAKGMVAVLNAPNRHSREGGVIAMESVDRGRFGWFPITLAFRTDHAGDFRIPALKGSYKIWATSAHDHGPDDRGPIVSPDAVPAVMPRVMNFDLGSGVDHQMLVLQTAPEVSIRGMVTLPDGKPARGVCLWLLAQIGEGNRLTPLRWTSTDGAGRYALTGIPQGLAQTHLEVFAEPPDNRSNYSMVASGRFQGSGRGRSVAFKPLQQDQDPLDFRLKLEHPQPLATPANPSAEENALLELGKEAERLQEVFIKARGENDSPARQLTLYREDHPHSRLAGRFLELAAANPDKPASINALGYIFRSALGAGDPEAPISKAREQAVDQVIQRHLANPDIVFFLTGFTYGVPTPKGETLLRSALDRSPDREVRAAACYELARFLQFKASLPDTLRKMKESPRPDDPFARQAKELWMRNLERLGDVDVPRARAEAEQLLERVGREFADVPQARYSIQGPGGVQISRVASPDPEAKTYGILAESALFELRRLTIGQPAPDIEGEDVDGRRFRLSEYRGRVVVLSFSGNWCGPCREMYPQERTLVERLKDRPFAMLGVNTDPDRETLQKSIREGEITWRNWWDGGQDGPITSRWNIRSFPTVFVIDAKGNIREIGLRGADLDRAMDRLLAETKVGKD